MQIDTSTSTPSPVKIKKKKCLIFLDIFVVDNFVAVSDSTTYFTVVALGEKGLCPFYVPDSQNTLFSQIQYLMLYNYTGGGGGGWGGKELCLS